MLGTFSFEPYFKSYCLFTFRSLEISEFAEQSIFFHLTTTPLLPAASAVRRLPATLGRLPAPPLARAGFHASHRSSPPPSTPRVVPSPPRHAAQNRPWPPPRRRRGGLGIELTALPSRAQKHYIYTRKLILSSFLLFPHPARPEHHRRPPAALGRPRATSCSRWRPRVAPELLHRFLLSAVPLPAVPRAPPSSELPAWPPPHRRRGPAKAEAATFS